MSKFGREAFEKEEISSFSLEDSYRNVLESFNKERRTDAATRKVNDTDVSSKDAFVYNNVILSIARKRRLTAEGPERASTTCSRSLRRGGGLRRYEIQRHCQKKETRPKVRRRYILVKETIQQNRNGVKKVQYSVIDIAKSV